MQDADLGALAELVRRDRAFLLDEWCRQVRGLAPADRTDVPTLGDHLPSLLEDLAVALETSADESIAESRHDASHLQHGMRRLPDGIDIAEVVAEYNILRGVLHDRAESAGLCIRGKAFHIVNRVLDGAIGQAVETYAAQRALAVTQRREEYLAFLAHDLRAPLNALSLAAQVLDHALQAQDGNPQNARMVKTLHRNVTHLAAMVTKVLEENRNTRVEGDVRLKPRQFELWPVVEVLIQSIHPGTGSAGPRLVNDVPDELVVFADVGLLRRVLQNLLANAIAYTPRGEVRIGAKERDGAVECWVTDDGAGIPRELLDTVFEKGETDPDKNGTGLGLAIVKSFVEAHGGTVHVESRDGSGTTFRFTLPAADQRPGDG